MIRIAVIGANGQAGRHIVAEALARGFEVTAFVRGSTAPAAQHVVHKDVLAIEQSDLAGFDAVVDALGFWTPDASRKDSASSGRFAIGHENAPAHRRRRGQSLYGCGPHAAARGSAFLP